MFGITFLPEADTIRIQYRHPKPYECRTFSLLNARDIDIAVMSNPHRYFEHGILTCPQCHQRYIRHS